MSVRLLFLDSSCPQPYDAETLKTKPQGGTESTVTRVAEGLAARGHEVIVAQKGRAEVGQGLAKYIGLDHLDQIDKQPHAVISLRTPSLVHFAIDKFPASKRFLWLHDFNQQNVVQAYPELMGTGLKIICVSRTHKTVVTSAMLSQIPPPIRGVTADFIYNPVDLEPDNTPVDNKKLVFFSSPHKGLDHALYLFGRLRDIDPTYTLHVANPGYYPSADIQVPGVIYLGCLCHSAVVGAVRSALAVFHPNFVFPETFGLVHAEANAVGTPVLTSTLGANREVLSDRLQTSDVRDGKIVIDTVLRWSVERPVVKGNPEFKLSNVLEQWEKVLDAK
jgi:glycosyltransferase involved in cell wall biosynthesis